MEDRHKFRVWDKKEKCYSSEFFEETELFLSSNGNFYWEDNAGDLIRASKNFIIEQCTGLKDKNGKLIYEGDKVDIADCDGYGVVYYNEESLNFNVKGYDYSAEDGCPHGEGFFQSGEFDEWLSEYNGGNSQSPDLEIIGDTHTTESEA